MWQMPTSRNPIVKLYSKVKTEAESKVRDGPKKFYLEFDNSSQIYIYSCSEAVGAGEKVWDIGTFEMTGSDYMSNYTHSHTNYNILISKWYIDLCIPSLDSLNIQRISVIYGRGTHVTVASSCTGSVGISRTRLTLRAKRVLWTACWKVTMFDIKHTILRSLP